jgi:hypothetical protein
LAADGDLLSSTAVAGALLTGGAPRAAVLAQKGTPVGPVVTLLPSDPAEIAAGDLALPLPGEGEIATSLVDPLLRFSSPKASFASTPALVSGGAKRPLSGPPPGSSIRHFLCLVAGILGVGSVLLRAASGRRTPAEEGIQSPLP